MATQYSITQNNEKIKKLTPHLLLNLFELMSNKKDKFRFIKDIKTWAYFNGKVWILDDAYDILAECLFDLAYAHELDNYGNVASVVKNTIINMQGFSRFRIKINKFDTYNGLLNCKNCVISLNAPKEEMKQEYNMDKYITKIANVEFDPEADCPTFKESLEVMFSAYKNPKEIIEWLQKILGLALSGYNLEQSFYMFHGNGRNGKSTLVEIIKDILGTYATSISKTFLSKQNARIDKYHYLTLRGVRFVNVNEFDSKDKFNESLLKQLTGGDSINFDINQKTFEWKPQAKLFFITNNLPKCTNGGVSMERRIKILQFKKQFYNNQNTALPLLLQKEKSGILNWLIEGYKKIDKKKPIEMPEELKHLSKKLHAETIEKGNMLIERYLIKDERHLITPQQAMFLMRNTKAYGFKGIKYEDYQPRFLAVALKKYASEIEEFSSKMQKFYIGVGISNEAYAYDVQDTINMSDSPLELGLESTNIEEQIRHHRAWVEFLTKKLEEDPEDKITQLKLKEYTTYLEFLLNYEKILNDKYNIEAEETQENNYYNIENSSDKATKTA